MSPYERNINDFVTIMNDESMYADLTGGFYILGWVFPLLTKVLGIVGIIALIFLVFRLAVDSLIISGVGNISLPFGGKGGGQGRTLGSVLGKFGSGNIEANSGDLKAYFRQSFKQTLLAFIVVGILVSGTALPITGEAVKIVGVTTNKILGIQPAEMIDSFDINAFVGQAGELTTASVKSSYEAEYEKLVSIYQQLNSGQVEPGTSKHKDLKGRYGIAYQKLDALYCQMSSRAQTDEEKKALGSYAQHVGYYESIFLPDTYQRRVNVSGGVVSGNCN